MTTGRSAAPRGGASARSRDGASAVDRTGAQLGLAAASSAACSGSTTGSGSRSPPADSSAARSAISSLASAASATRAASRATSGATAGPAAAAAPSTTASTRQRTPSSSLQRLADDVPVQVVAEPPGQRRGRRRQREDAVGQLVHLGVLQQRLGRALVPLDDREQLGPDPPDVGGGELAVGRRAPGWPRPRASAHRPAEPAPTPRPPAAGRRGGGLAPGSRVGPVGRGADGGRLGGVRLVLVVGRLGGQRDVRLRGRAPGRGPGGRHRIPLSHGTGAAAADRPPDPGCTVSGQSVAAAAAGAAAGGRAAAGGSVRRCDGRTYSGSGGGSASPRQAQRRQRPRVSGPPVPEVPAGCGSGGAASLRRRGGHRSDGGVAAGRRGGLAGRPACSPAIDIRRSSRSRRCSVATADPSVAGSSMRAQTSSSSSRGAVVPRISVRPSCTVSAIRDSVAEPERLGLLAHQVEPVGRAVEQPVAAGVGTASSTIRSRSRSSRSVANRRGSCPASTTRSTARNTAGASCAASASMVSSSSASSVTPSSPTALW